MAWSSPRPAVEARALRHDLGLRLSDRLDPFDLAAKRGIEVVHLEIGEKDEVEGAFQRRGGHDFVLINAAKPGRRQRFTMAHELGHAVLLGGDADLIDTNDDLDRGPNAIERDANIFATELLVPEAGAVILIEGLSDADAAGAIVRTYEVSPRSAAIRVCELRHLGSQAEAALFEAVDDYKTFWREQDIPRDVKPRARAGTSRRFRERAEQLHEIGLISDERYAELVERPLHPAG